MSDQNKITATHSDMRQLAMMIYDFLIDEDTMKDLPKHAKRHINTATDCLQKVYKIKFGDFVFFRSKHTLRDLHDICNKPVTIKKRILAVKHKQKGNEYMDARRYQLAESEYTKAMELDKTNAVYFCNRAVSKVRQGIVHTAIQDFNRALDLDSQYVKAYNWLGLAHALLEHPARAHRCYQKALEIEPDNAVCFANMELINRTLNRRTFKVLQTIYRGSPNFIRMAGDRNVFKGKKDADKDEEIKRKREITEKFSSETLD